MSIPRHRLLLARLGVAALVVLATRARSDDFASARLTAGVDAYASKRFPEAVDQFRIACFGLLDQPVVLTEGLVRLALAQEAAGRKADATATLHRFLEIEKRFSGYARARLDGPTRAAFETLLKSHVSAEVLAAVPSMSGAPPKAGAAPETRKAP